MRRDPLNEVVLPIVGACILAALWWYDYIPLKLIKTILVDAY